MSLMIISIYLMYQLSSTSCRRLSLKVTIKPNENDFHHYLNISIRFIQINKDFIVRVKVKAIFNSLHVNQFLIALLVYLLIRAWE